MNERHRKAAAIDPDALRLLIRQKLADGRLTRRQTAKVMGGPGKAGVCHVCEMPILKNALTMEPMFQEGSNESLPMHVHCFWAWEEEVTHFSV